MDSSLGVLNSEKKEEHGMNENLRDLRTATIVVMVIMVITLGIFFFTPSLPNLYFPQSVRVKVGQNVLEVSSPTVYTCGEELLILVSAWAQDGLQDLVIVLEDHDKRSPVISLGGRKRYEEVFYLHNLFYPFLDTRHHPIMNGKWCGGELRVSVFVTDTLGNRVGAVLFFKEVTKEKE